MLTIHAMYPASLAPSTDGMATPSSSWLTARSGSKQNIGTITTTHTCPKLSFISQQGDTRCASMVYPDVYV